MTSRIARTLEGCGWGGNTVIPDRPWSPREDIATILDNHPIDPRQANYPPQSVGSPWTKGEEAVQGNRPATTNTRACPGFARSASGGSETGGGEKAEVVVVGSPPCRERRVTCGGLFFHRHVISMPHYIFRLHADKCDTWAYEMTRKALSRFCASVWCVYYHLVYII
jgi:hypothetical protein